MKKKVFSLANYEPASKYLGHDAGVMLVFFFLAGPPVRVSLRGMISALHLD